MQKKFYVYIITNNLSKRKYIGSRICYKDPENDNYMGSSRYLKADIKLHGKENFSKEILCFCKNDIELLDKESSLIIEHNTLTPNGYNRFIPNQKPGFSMSGIKHSEETKQRMSESMKGKNKGRIFTDEHKKRISESMKGKNSENKSEETKQKISKTLEGRKLSEEIKRKISNSKKGIKNSKQHNQRIKDSWVVRKMDIQS